MIYCFMADGFEEVEAVAPIDMLRRADIEVKLVSINKTNVVTSSRKIAITCDMNIDEIKLNDELVAIILPGGMPGTINLENNEKVQLAIDFCNQNERLICAICAAPSILGHKNLLCEKNATVYPGFESDLIGAKLSDKFVVKDENIITARGAGVAIAFGLEIVKAIKGEELSKKIKEMIMCE